MLSISTHLIPPHINGERYPTRGYDGCTNAAGALRAQVNKATVSRQALAVALADFLAAVEDVFAGTRIDVRVSSDGAACIPALIAAAGEKLRPHLPWMIGRATFETGLTASSELVLLLAAPATLRWTASRDEIDRLRAQAELVRHLLRAWNAQSRAAGTA